jgi:predicted DNA-binding mobile mystery protein A
MAKSRIAVQSRKALDDRFSELRHLTRLTPPTRGWVKAIREALGMSTMQLAKRLKLKQPTIVAMEQSEAKGTIQLKTLRRLAEAINCSLVYALVPDKTLEEIVNAQARKVARRRLQSVEQTMLLENQSVPAKDFEKRIEALANDIKPSGLWDEP